MKPLISITPDTPASRGRAPRFRAECGGYVWNFSSRNKGTGEDLQRDAVEALATMVFAGRGPGLTEYSSGWNWVVRL